MTKLRLIPLLLVALVLAGLALGPTAPTPSPHERESKVEQLGPSRQLVESYGIERTSRKHGPIAAVATGVERPAPAGLHLVDRPQLARGRGKPNIVLFLTDDMALRDLEGMPAVQRLIADSGTTFGQATSADSLCCPARATLVTGKAAHNHRTIGNELSSVGGWLVFKKFNDTSRLLPVWLQQAGYRTWLMGKYLNGYNGNDPQPGWDYFYAPTHGVFDPFRWVTAVNGRWVRYRHSYQQAVVTKYARHDLATFARRGEAFFMFVQSIAPHGFWHNGHWVDPIPERRYRSTVPPALMWQAPNVAELRAGDKSEWVRTQPIDPLPNTENWARRLESLKSVDDTVTAMVEQARRSGVYDNTIFIFTSDNGFSFGSHRYVGKNVPYEESVRVPLVITGPGFTGGGVVRDQVTLEDVTASIVRAAGARPAWPLDGVPLQDVVAQPRAHADRPVLVEGSVGGLPGSDELPVDRIGRFYRAVRWRSWKLIEYATGERELYDLRHDPYELTNVYDGARTPEARRPTVLRVQRELERWIATHHRCVGARACTESPAASARPRGGTDASRPRGTGPGAAQ